MPHGATLQYTYYSALELILTHESNYQDCDKKPSLLIPIDHLCGWEDDVYDLLIDYIQEPKNILKSIVLTPRGLYIYWSTYDDFTDASTP